MAAASQGQAPNIFNGCKGAGDNPGATDGLPDASGMAGLRGPCGCGTSAATLTGVGNMANANMVVPSAGLGAWYDDLLSYGTDVYKAKLALEKAQAEGASAAQLAAIQQQIIAAQQSQQYQNAMETRRLLIFGGAGILSFMAFMAYMKGRNTTTRRRRRK